MSLKAIGPCAAVLTALVTSTAFAQDADYVNPCSEAPNTDFDFWVQEWVAFNYDTGVVMGIDNVSKIDGGCVVFQDWTQMTDDFRAPGSDVRYAGVSFNSVLNDGRWQQVWVGDYGGTIVVTGGLNEDGTMVLTSGEQVAASGQTYQRTWYWDPQDDGTVHSWGEATIMNEDGTWGEPIITWNLRYVSRHVVGNLIEAPAE